MHRPIRPSDSGFSLVELIVAIVVVSVLATVVVLAIRGRTDAASQTACDSDAKTLELAESAYSAQHGSYATEAELVAAGVLRSQSTLNDISVTGDHYTITVVAPCEPGSSTAATPATSTQAPASPTSSSTTTPTSTTIPPSSTAVATSTTTVPTSTTVPPTTTSVPSTTTSTTSTSSTTTSTVAPTTTSTLAPTTTTTAPINKLVFLVQPTSAAQNATITTAITVAVRDASNNTITSSAATITLSITPLSGSPAGRLTCTTNPKSAVAGVATFGACSINKKDVAYTLTASSPGITSAVSATFNIT